MKWKLKLIGAIFQVEAVVFLSSKKELSCETCNEGNQPPIALAGPDVAITLPTDSISLDGSRPSDPDGTISAWQWTKVSGPAFFAIISGSAAKTSVKKSPGRYLQFLNYKL